jgi:hypothetical protein
MNRLELLKLATRKAHEEHEVNSSSWYAYRDGFIDGFRKAEQKQYIKNIMKSDEDDGLYDE